MKNNKLINIIGSILGVILLLFLVFEVAIMFNSTLNESLNRSLEISITLFAMFSTFGGAYLGAKISGDNARKLEIERRKNEIEEKNLRIKIMFKMNLDNISDVHRFFCSYYDIDQFYFLYCLKKVRNTLYGEHNKPLNLSENKHIRFLERFMKEWKIKADWYNPIFREINNFNNLFSEVSNQMIYFKEKDLNTIFQLKQVLSKLEYYIIFNEKEQNYTLKKGNEQEFENFKAIFMLFSLLYIDLTEEILDVEINCESKHT